jgi:hypothetical protein
MRAHGFTAEQMVELARARLATATTERIVGGARKFEGMKAMNLKDEKLRNAHQRGASRSNPALLQTSNVRFAQVDDGEVIGFVKQSIAGDNAAAVAVALANTGPREFWFHFGDIEVGPPSSRRHVKSIENLITGERRMLEWGGVRLRIDPQQDPALLFRCLT